MSGLYNLVQRNPRFKKLVYRLIVAGRESRPRFWTRVFINPFVHKIGKSVIIRRRTRLDVFPFNKFQVGYRSIIEDFCTINNGVGDVIIGENTLIGIGNVLIGPVSIGKNVILAQNIVISGLNHGYEDVGRPIRDQDVRTKPIIIGDECWIGANSVITSGVTIGKHCVIGAGSVVTQDIPDFSVAIGNPARIVKQFDSEKNLWLRI